MMTAHQLSGATERFLIDDSKADGPGRWIEHDGQGCPVRPEARVHAQFRHDRDRRAAERLNIGEGVPAWAYGESWTHHDWPTDITFYREVRV